MGKGDGGNEESHKLKPQKRKLARNWGEKEKKKKN